jgi:hypothetical protein
LEGKARQAGPARKKKKKAKIESLAGFGGCRAGGAHRIASQHSAAHSNRTEQTRRAQERQYRRRDSHLIVSASAIAGRVLSHFID